MSVKNDINQAIKYARRIGNSKKEYRENDKRHFIHSREQLKKVEQVSQEFGRFVKGTYGINKLHLVNEQHYRHFLATKSETTFGHQRNIETALQQLQKGAEQRAEKLQKEFKTFVPAERITSNETDEIKNRSYTPNEIEAIKNGGVTDNTKVAIELMHNTGMRVSEACSVEVQNINFERDFVSVIGKGGLYREIPLKSDFRGYLERLTENMDKHERLVGTAEKTVSANCKAIADKVGVENWTGTHGFRHTYARNEINEKMTGEEKELFHRCLDNYAEGKQFDYAVTDKELYNSMKDKMDQVHKSLGHGENRFDLALRYMR